MNDSMKGQLEILNHQVSVRFGEIIVLQIHAAEQRSIEMLSDEERPMGYYFVEKIYQFAAKGGGRY